MYRIRETYIRKKIQILIWILNMITWEGNNSEITVMANDILAKIKNNIREN